MPFDETFKNQYIGMSSSEMLVDLKKRYHIPDAIADLLAEKDRYYMEIARQKTHLFPEMKIFLDKLKAAGFKLALASGSSLAVIREILAMTHITPYFDSLTSTEEVVLGKPHPAIFLEAARRIDTAPHACLVIEDSWRGVQAAKSAAMFCVAIPTLFSEELNPVFHSADLLITQGISAFNAEDVCQWIENLQSKS